LIKSLLNISILLLLSILISSCNFSSEIANEIYATNLNTKKKESYESVETVLEKYIYAGMDVKSALKLLDEQGFDITEYSVLGYRNYPNGDLRLYADDEAIKLIKKNLGVADISYSARRAKGVEWLTSNVIISFSTKNNLVFQTKAYVSVD
jgi:hypothetical protein